MRSPITRSRPIMPALALALAAGSAAGQATDWTNPGTGDLFDAVNWSNGVPTAAADALINNGGSAESASATAADLEAMNLSIGVDGGFGSLFFTSNRDSRIRVSSDLNIGATFSGVNPSAGSLVFSGDAIFSDIAGNGLGVFRVGYTNAPGDGMGVLLGPRAAFDVGFGAPEFAMAQWGVSEGSGAASADIQLGGFVSMENFTRHLDIGVARAGGDATASVRGVDEFSGAGAFGGVAGDLSIGVSSGTGRAEGAVTVNPDYFTSVNGSARGWATVNVGVANATGTAIGVFQTAQGLVADTLNLGVSAGGGAADGTFEDDHGLSILNTLNLGGGARLIANVAGVNRAIQGASEYSAIDTGTATLDGELVVDFWYSAEDGDRFELINTPDDNGITGDFDTVTFLNLPQGTAASGGIVFDGFVEKYVVDITGQPALPNWTNPSAGPSGGDWYDGSNWTSPDIPGPGDAAVISNGGTVVADSSTASGPMTSLTVTVGQTADSGSIESQGVNLEPRRVALIGVSRPGSSGGTPISGAVHLRDADLIVRSRDHAFVDDLGGRVFVGLSQGGTAPAQGSLTIDRGSLVAPQGIRLGDVAASAPGANASAAGTLTLNGGGRGVSSLETNGIAIRVATARNVSGQPGATLNASANLAVSDASILSDANAGEATAGQEADSVSADASIALSNVEVRNADLDISDADASGTASSANSTVNVSFNEVDFSADAGAREIFTWGLASSFAAGAAATAAVDVQGDRLTIDNPIGDLEIACASSFGGTSAQPTSANAFAVVDLHASVITCDEFQIVEVDSFDIGTARADVEVMLSDGSTVHARELDLGYVDVFGSAEAVTDIGANLSLFDSTMTLSEEAFVGELRGPFTNPASSAEVTLLLDSSVLSATEVRVGARNEPGGNLRAGLELFAGFVSTEMLTVGPDGRVETTITGLTRAASGSAVIGTYGAIDATAAALDGEIVADVNFSPPAGEHDFDLVRTTGLITGTPTVTVSRLPLGFVVDSFAVVNDPDGDVLRLTISGAPPCNSADLAEPFGVLDLSDIIVFVAAFLSQEPLGDLSDDGVWDLTDINLFTTRFLRGCD